MGIYIVRHRRAIFAGEEVLEPDLPKGVRGEFLCRLRGEPSASIMDVSPPAEADDDPYPWKPPPSCSQLPQRLRTLLESALRYPPALAWAMEEYYADDWDAPIQRDEFLERIADCLEHHLLQQSAAPFLLARAKVSHHIGYLWADQFTWIVGYDALERKVGWVSGDYHIYTAPVDDFDVDEETLARRFGRNPESTAEKDQV